MTSKRPAASVIAIIGAGSVGSSIAFALLIQRVVGVIILVDVNEPLCKAQVQDLQDATSMHNVKIRQGTFEEAGKADIIIFTAGAKQKVHETRLDLIDRNISVMNAILSSLGPNLSQDAILLVVTNPVDILTAYLRVASGLPANQVLGTGTVLDSIRLIRNLAQKFNVSDESVQALVIGEHGESQVVAWSSTHLPWFTELSEAEKETLARTTRQTAVEIIAVKGSTSYGVAAATTLICEAIIFDLRKIMPVSRWREQYGCSVSLPSIVGRSGAVECQDFHLADDERATLDASIAILKETYTSCAETGLWQKRQERITN